MPRGGKFGLQIAVMEMNTLRQLGIIQTADCRVAREVLREPYTHPFSTYMRTHLLTFSLCQVFEQHKIKSFQPPLGFFCFMIYHFFDGAWDSLWLCLCVGVPVGVRQDLKVVRIFMRYATICGNDSARVCARAWGTEKRDA
uniref:Uncharacterized protein n=1 Tax=Eutreptiella gymnastica TaxID=73025 RepID=A0A7S4G6X0_9EUGL